MIFNSFTFTLKYEFFILIQKHTLEPVLASPSIVEAAKPVEEITGE